MASSNNEELVVDHAGGVEAACTGTDHISFELDFSPTKSLEVEDPEVIQIGHTFSSEDGEVRILKFCGMIGAFPGSGLVLLGVDLDPLLSLPVEDVDRVEALFVGSSSSEDHDLVTMRVIVHGAVGAVRRFFASGLDFFPFKGVGVVGPEVVHVVGV